MITSKVFGTTKDGREVLAFTLEDGARRAVILDYGGIIQSVVVPDRDGKPVDVILGYNDVAGYEDNGGYLGALIGRFGNRIGEGKLTVDGKEYQSKNLALRVLSVPVDTVHTDQFYGPKEIMKVPFSWADWSPIFWLSLLLLAWTLLLTYFYIRYRDNKPIIKIIKLAPKVLPHTKAMQEIDQIKAEKAWAKEDSKEYYTRLTSILRTYIEKRYGFNAMEMTSAEIIDRLLTENAESLDELRALFQTADLVKFAKYSTLINENDANLVNAIEFINQTKREADPKAQAVPDEVVVEQKRSRRTLLGMRVGLAVATLAGVALLVWICGMVYELIA